MPAPNVDGCSGPQETFRNHKGTAADTWPQRDGGNVTGAPGSVGAPRSQSRSSAGAKVGLETNKTVLNKRQDLSNVTYQTIRLE